VKFYRVRILRSSDRIHRGRSALTVTKNYNAPTRNFPVSKTTEIIGSAAFSVDFKFFLKSQQMSLNDNFRAFSEKISQWAGLVHFFEIG